ncbi:LacI family transcriptional regulator [Flavobacteriaceae bacterium]|jgi:LacI family transcriptional regulator|nr:LacI family transcriptional regulator [Flavobacteriaceae bacterium]MDA9886597.1 LacI family transcriptional regulator [Flavobacteriaceae bacterium]MDA9984887.1 LacI family transcriptional regulator [Flavobacteriaceae bacterium]MDB2672643.1 LacI family transcriptional regulator [Flavobacteriaceae bacterium]MDB9822023.1 LacI family transcriptional regulator [Flavobacteriaceae bacterium]
MKNLTLKDIAAALNLSITTVSKALKDYPDVNTNTKERVKAYAKKVNFTPNAHAAFLRTQQSKLIGVVIPRLNHFFFSNVLRGIMKAAEEEDYMVIVLSSDESYELEKKQINRLLQQNVDGILLSIADSTHDTKHIDAIIEQKIPLIFFDKYSKLSNCSSVVINDQKAAFNAVEHLIKQGKKNIAHLRGPLLPQNSIDRFLGYRKALEQYGLEYRKEWVFTCDQISNEEGYAYTQEIIEKHPEIDAIFAVADMPAVGAIKCLNEQKIVIPDQIAVMGFSNWRISNLVTPTLSTVNQPGIEMGEKAFELFYKEQQLIKKGESVVYEKIELDTKLIIRQSS